MELRLFEASPAWTIEDDTLIGFDLSFTRGLRIVGLDPSCETDQALDELSSRLNEVLCTAPEQALIRFYSIELAAYDDFLLAYEKQFDPNSIGGHLAQKKVEQCRTRLAPRRREIYCFVSTPTVLPFSHYNPGTLGRRAGRMLQRARELHESGVQQATRLAKTMARALGAAGLDAEILAARDLFTTLWRLSNPVLSRTLDPPEYRPDVVLRTQLFASGLVNGVDRYQREGLLNRVMTMKLPPRQILSTQAIELQALPFVHQLVVTFRRIGDADALHRVETNRRQGHELDGVLSKVRGDRHAQLPDHQLVQQQADANDVLARLTRGEKLYDVAIQVWFPAPNEEELQKRTEAVMSRFRACGQAEGAVEELRGRFAFLSMLPGHHGLLGERYHAFLASRAADLVPVCQVHSGSKTPLAVLATRGGELVGFHPFQPGLYAWNATVAGTTGSGKSFAVRTLLNGWLASGGRVVVATRGRDYHRYAEIFSGPVYDVALDDTNLALGPFPPPAKVLAQGQREVALDHLAGILGIMVSDGREPLDRLKRRLIYKATESLYLGLSPEAPAPTFRDWAAALEGLADSERDSRDLVIGLIKQIRFWIEGPYGPAFCRNRPALEAHKLSVWNLERIQDADTQGVILGVLSGIIAQSIQIAPTIVVLDEVWSIFKSDAGAALVETLYRTVRKQGSAIWTISQSMNDYVALPEVTRSAILNNSLIKLFLAHDSSEIDLVTSLFKLTTREAAMLASLRSEPGRFSELLGFFGKRRQVVTLTPTGIEYWLATSHPKDTEWERLAMREFPDVSRLDLIKQLARSYPNGAIS